MGQYRQWLQCRETDRQLHEQMRTLEEQLVQLQAQVDYTHTEEALADNMIMRALAIYAQNKQADKAIEQTLPERQSIQSFSPALQARGSFSAAATPENRQPLRQQQGVNKANAIPTTPHTELTLLPDDINAFIDEHTQTGQQRPPAWWLQTIQQNIPPTPQTSPADGLAEQSTRTNRLVQRWVARWGQQLNQPQETTKDHDHE